VARSPFRFVTSSKQGQYGVHRGEEHFGHVTKIVHRITDRGVTRTFSTWMPSTLDRRDLPSAKTREAAARALWTARQEIR
jgi:hypothetical protein